MAAVNNANFVDISEKQREHRMNIMYICIIKMFCARKELIHKSFFIKWV